MIPCSTQIGGKYRPDDDTLFDIKRRLVDAGVIVTHPIADNMIFVKGGTGFAFDPTVYSFIEIERAYYLSIARSTFHTVANGNDLEGYIGESACIELSFAMLLSRPILLTQPPTYKEAVDPALRELLIARNSLLEVHDLLSLTDSQLHAVITQLGATGHVEYKLTSNEQALVRSMVRSLFRGMK